jgi:GNAT superfamily N-acetyltransferase
MKPGVTYQFINDVFRGPIYGRHDIFTARSFKDFVQRNDVDLSRAIFAFDGCEPIGTIIFAQRGERAWLSLMGILPEYRRRGLGRTLFGAAVDAVRASGATDIEFEVVQRNVAVQEMYKGFGFETEGELYVWSRKPRRVGANGLVSCKHPVAEIERIACGPAACWQRQAIAVARTPSVLIEIEGAYAFVRLREDSGYILDAAAPDERSARALLDELDTRIPYDITLFNEPAGSPLSRALEPAGWKIVERQFRMRNRR